MANINPLIKRAEELLDKILLNLDKSIEEMKDSGSFILYSGELDQLYQVIEKQIDSQTSLTSIKESVSSMGQDLSKEKLVPLKYAKLTFKYLLIESLFNFFYISHSHLGRISSMRSTNKNDNNTLTTLVKLIVQIFPSGRIHWLAPNK